jgi:hypothetical protein
VRERSYLALIHHPVLEREGKIVSSAITALDLHDFSRLARTYGLGGVFAQTNLPMQAALAQRLMDHWVRGAGAVMNPNRREALEILRLVETLDEAVERIRDAWGEEPLLAATSAREDGRRVTFAEARERVQGLSRPLLVLFGTSWGLAPSVLERCDWVIEPIGSPSGFNHLSVRSAASITVDRLFG